jgi:cytochrome c5
MNRYRIVSVIIFALPLAGCSDSGTKYEGSTAPSGPAYDLELGERVFSKVCLDCHGDASTPAPAIANARAWEARLQQNPRTLVDHAIRGYRQMPPKGGHAELTDTEVTAAVAYVMDRARRIIRSKHNLERLSACDPLLDPTACPENVPGDLMTLQMLYLLNRYSEVK